MSVFRLRICLILTAAVAFLVLERRASFGTERQFDASLDGFRLSVSDENAGPNRSAEVPAEVGLKEESGDPLRREGASARRAEDDLAEASESNQKAPTSSPRPCGQTRVPSARRAEARSAAPGHADRVAGLARLQI